MNDTSSEFPQIANLAQPVGHLLCNGMSIDSKKLAQAADKLGAGKSDVLSVAGYRNAAGQLVPDYDTVRIERHVEDDDE